MTDTTILFALIDTTAKDDSTPSSSNVQPFCDLTRDLLLDTTLAAPAWATLEPDSFLLDGSRVPLPDDLENTATGLWSSTLSDDSGTFSAPPVLQIDFRTEHSSMGLTLHFWAGLGEWASSLRVQWYDAVGGLMATGMYYPDASDYFCAKKVEGYRRIKITFYCTNIPCRYLKLAGIDYGVWLTFGGRDVVSAKILEEIDPLSDTISINTLALTLHDSTGGFGILNPAGYGGVLQSGQQFVINEQVDGVQLDMGTFYLSDWSNESDQQAKFSAVDAIGLLDGDPWPGGVYDTKLEAFLADLLEGYTYTLDASLADLPVKGYLPAGTKRDALQQAAFASCAVVDCSRGAAIRIYPPPDRPSALIGYDRKFSSGGKVTLAPLVTGVAVTATTYTPGTATEELYREELPAGAHRITLGDPASGYSVIGGSIVASAAVYVDIMVPTACEVVLTGAKYIATATTLQCTASDLPANAQPNVLTVDSPALLARTHAAAVAEHILKRYADRIQLEWRMVAGAERLGDRLIVASYRGEMVRGIMQSMELDLTGGMVAKCLLLGSRISTTAAAYAGEIYAGERSVF